MLSTSYNFFRAIVWDAIVLGSNKKGGPLRSIVQSQFSWWQLFGGNYLGEITGEAIFLGGVIRGATIQGDNYPKGNYLGGSNCPGGNYQGRNCLVPFLEASAVVRNYFKLR